VPIKKSVKQSVILGTGSYLPANIVTNFDLEKIVDTTDTWITERSGIKQRHYIGDTETTSDMAYYAARNAIETAKIDRHDIDMILCATVTPDFLFPSVAALVQHKLGITNECAAFDISVACAGFVYALSIADQFLKTGNAKNILVIGADSMSRIVDFTDRTTCVLFGDGAGAFIISSDKKYIADLKGTSDKPADIMATVLQANGGQGDILQTKGSTGNPHEKYGYLTMKGQEVFKVAVKNLSDIMTKTLEKGNLSPHELDYVVPHQANQRIMTATAQKIGVSDDRVISYIAKHGNTSAASVPLAFDCAVKDGTLHRGHTILMEAIGGGMSWAGALIRY
jgi:3-oxoacyl-[acyl-carrier-protein] synthase III